MLTILIAIATCAALHGVKAIVLAAVKSRRGVAGVSCSEADRHTSKEAQ